MPQAPVRRYQPRQPKLAVVDHPGPQEITWAEAVTRFLESKRRGGLTASTLENYAYHIDGVRARQFLQDHGITRPGQLSKDLMDSLRGELLDAGLSTSHANAHLRVMKTFARWCREEGYGVDAEVLTAKGIKQASRIPDAFTVTEEKRLLAAARTPRDKLLVEFMLRTGLRLTEVCNVTLDDITESPVGPVLMVRQGKGRKDRALPLDTGAVQFSAKIQRYIRQDRPKSANRHLFLTSRLQDGDYGPLTPRAVQILIHRLGKEAGVHAHPHKFRHTFATRTLAAGVNPLYLQRALGHTTLAMTNRYVHSQTDDLVAAWKARRD